MPQTSWAKRAAVFETAEVLLSFPSVTSCMLSRSVSKGSARTTRLACDVMICVMGKGLCFACCGSNRRCPHSWQS